MEDGMDWSLFSSIAGRITRKTWWLYTLGLGVAVWIVTLLLGLIFSSGNGTNAFGLILIYLITLVASAAGIVLGIKRLHDTDKSGWYWLIGLVPVLGGLVLLYWCGFQKGTPGANKYGEPPV
jgi:uncharacterized membrane protein YhaH (DUF805 family)